MKTPTRSRLARMVLVLASSILLVSLAPLSAQASGASYFVTATVPVGERPGEAALDATTNKSYVPNRMPAADY